jgi:membrane associated rhomboid family serine protease
VVFFEIAVLPASFVIGVWFLLQLASAVAPVAAEMPQQVAWFAHLGGFASGVIIASATPQARSQRLKRRSARRRAASADTRA